MTRKKHAATKPQRTLKQGRRAPAEAITLAFDNERGEQLLRESLAITEAFDVAVYSFSCSLQDECAAITAAFDVLYEYEMDETVEQITGAFDVLYSSFSEDQGRHRIAAHTRTDGRGLTMAQIREASSFASVCRQMMMRSCFMTWRWNNAKCLLPKSRRRGEEEPRLRKRKGKVNKPPSIQSIIAAIITQESISPPSPRHCPRDNVELACLLDLPEGALQQSPRMRAKAIATGVLKARPLASCAVSPKNKGKGATRVWQLNAQPRVINGF